MKLLDDAALEAALREIGAKHYHNLHPFHKMLHSGGCTRAQVQAWALNRYYYQCSIPRKDALIVARFPDAESRRAWRQRLVDHDGDAPGDGGIARWLRLATGVGLDAELVESCRAILPITRYAVDAYVNFVRERSLLEAVASSLTEMFSPTIISERVAGMLANYDFVDRDTLVYFNARLHQAPRDADFALKYVKQHARTVEQQQAALGALRFKCDLLWAQLDALYMAYVTPGMIPAGAFLSEASSLPAAA
ncbi:MAG TPA: pyrroloquinoline-quinone synthase PqqC [Acidocella sp.]|nr:pyrroloquinoline-quinone synthase PqqC [Acidocella sp.]